MKKRFRRGRSTVWQAFRGPVAGGLFAGLVVLGLDLYVNDRITDDGGSTALEVAGVAAGGATISAVVNHLRWR